MLLSQAHRDEQVCVDVDVVVSVDGDGDGDVAVGGSDHRHNRVSICTCGICLPGTASRFSNVEGYRTCCAAQLIKQRGVPSWNLFGSSSGQSKELDRTAVHVELLKAEHGDSGSSCI